MPTIDKLSLDGKVIVVTGAAGYLGEMHVEAIIEAGGIPVLIDINETALSEVTMRLKEKYSDCSVLAFVKTITNKGDMLYVKNEILKEFGRIDGLINNACNNPTMKNEGIIGRFEDLEYDEWSLDMEVGLYGAICCSQVFGTYFAENCNGVIVNISSDLGIVAPNQNLYHIEGRINSQQPKKPVAYSTVKWGLIGLTKYLSTYWAEQNVRVNALAFGGVYNNQSEIFLSRVEKLIPMRRMAKRDEYKGSIIYMLSDATSYMTGSVVTIDGGRTAW